MRISTRVTAVLLASAASVGFVNPLTAAAAPSGSAVTDFGACLASQRSGDLLVMIDESSSLQTSDPGAARVTSAEYLVGQLAAFEKSSGVDLNVAVAGFADTYSVDLDWTALDGGTLPAINEALDGFRARNQGIDTDYWLALDGARETLAARTAGVEGAGSCQAVAWFSDGKIDFTSRGDTRKPYAPDTSLDSQAGVDQVVGTATESICRPGGVADQLRSSGVVLFGIGLAAGTASPADFDVMRSIATGEPSGATTCGAISSPSPGDFFLAQNIDELLFAFDAFSTPGQSPLSREAGVCAQSVCEEGKHRFVLDRSIGGVAVLGSADMEGLVPTLVSPLGDQVPLPDTSQEGRTDVGGVNIDYRWQSARTISIEMSNASAPQWQGLWSLVFVDPAGSSSARSKSNIHISGNLFPAWKVQHTVAIHSGEPSVPVDLAIVDSARSEIDPESLLGRASLSVVLIGQDGQQRTVAAGIPKDGIDQPVALDLTDVPAGRATLRLTLDVTTADALTVSGQTEPGTPLAPQSVDIPLAIAPPIGYPTLPSKIDFGTLEGSGQFGADVPVAGPGCVWLPGSPPASVLASPDGAGSITVASSIAAAAECVQVEEGQTGSIPVSLSVPNSVNGVVNGLVTLMVAPAGELDRALAVDVPFTAALEKPLDKGNFILALIVALLLGPGIPLLLLYGGKWFTSRIPARTLKAQQFPVTVSGSTVLRDGRPFALTDRDLIEVVRGLDSPARQLDIGGLVLRTRVGRSPVGAGFVVVESGVRAGASGSSPSTSGPRPHARLPLAVHNTWFVLHDPAGPFDAATVVLLVGDDAGPTVRSGLVDDMRSRLPGVLSDLRARATPASGSPGAPASGPPADSFDPFGGTPQGSSPLPGYPGAAPSDPFDPFRGGSNR